MPPEDIPDLISKMARDRKELSKQINEIMWYSRGSLSREEAWTLCIEERKEHSEAIEKRIDTVQKTGLPLI
jgi:hypothetical protein